MANQPTALTAAREAQAVATVDSTSSEVAIDQGESASLVRAIQGLRRQLAAEFRALKLTLVSGQFIDTH